MLELVNVFIDNALSVSWRLIDLPTTALLTLALILCIALGVALKFLHRQGIAKRGLLQVAPSLWGLALLALFAFTIDARFLRLKKQLELLDQRLLHISSTACDKSPPTNAQTQVPPPEEIPRLVGKLTSDFEIVETDINPAIRLVTLRRSEPRAVLYVTTVNLQDPRTEIVLNPSPTTRKLTSDFAKENDLEIAINGEAGQSRHADVGFGSWIGPYVVNGRTIFSETKYKRPMMLFTTDRTARFVPRPSGARLSSDRGYNVIWGRLSVLSTGREELPPDQSLYPRTMMGIDQQGHTLVLLVADGRQPLHSMGITYADGIEVLRAFGVSDAMACDQGGSSTLYVKKLGGVVNQPSDGSERPVYTHFGVRYHPTENK